MKNNLLALSALLLGGLATPAFAQNYGDLILGFTSSGTGSSTNLEVDLGSVNTYQAQAAGTYIIADLSSDLNTVYGSSVNTSALDFGIVGTNSTNTTPTFGTYDASYVVRATFVGAAETTPGSPATPYGEAGAGSYTGPISNVVGVLGLTSAAQGFPTGTSLSDITGHVSGVGTTLKGITIGASALGSFSQAGGATGFNLPNAAAQFQQTTSLSGAAVEVFATAPVNGGTSVDINPNSSYFELLGNGTLEFVVVPEPSTYAAIVGVAVLGYALLRRRRSLA
jgi:hypothetical protein